MLQYKLVVELPKGAEPLKRLEARLGGAISAGLSDSCVLSICVYKTKGRSLLRYDVHISPWRVDPAKGLLDNEEDGKEYDSADQRRDESSQDGWQRGRFVWLESNEFEKESVISTHKLLEQSPE